MGRILKISFFVLVFFNKVLSQQDPVFSLYMFNQLALNPAFAGNAEGIAATLMHRRQWIGINYGATVSNFTMHSAFKNKSIGVGFSGTSQSVFFYSRLASSLSLSYKINFSSGILSFGINAGLLQASHDYNGLTIMEEEKPYLTSSYSYLRPDFGAGLYFANNKFYTGISAQHLNPEKEGVLTGSVDVIRRHFYYVLGYKKEMGGNFVLIPSLLLKYAGKSLFQGDFTVHLKYNDFIWTGLTFRTNYVGSFQFGFNFNDLIQLPRQNVKIGYAYDFDNSRLNLISKGSHEIMLIMDFIVHQKIKKIRKNKAIISPVFF